MVNPPSPTVIVGGGGCSGAGVERRRHSKGLVEVEEKENLGSVIKLPSTNNFIRS